MATVMDTASGEVKAEIPVGVEPEGVGVSPNSKYTVVTSESTSMAHVVDNAALKLIANVLVDTRPREAKFTPDGKEVWVSSEVGGTIAVINSNTWKVLKKIRFEVPGVRPKLLQPVGMEFTKDGKYLFVALGPGNRVAVIDPKTYEVLQYILVGQRPWHLELSPDGQALRGQRSHQRHDHHRRCEPQGREVGSGRTPALGRRHHSVNDKGHARQFASATLSLPADWYCCTL